MRDRGERGANLVELAILIPLLLLLLIGVADLGRAFYGKIAVTNAAREGARRGITLPFPMLSGGVAEIEAVVRQELSSSGFDEDLVSITIDASGTSIIVTTAYPVHLVLGGMLGLPEELVVRNTAEMLWLVGA